MYIAGLHAEIQRGRGYQWGTDWVKLAVFGMWVGAENRIEAQTGFLICIFLKVKHECLVLWGVLHACFGKQC